MARPRLRAVLVSAAVLVTAVPLVSQATAPHLTCGVKQTGSWERIPVSAFQPVNGISGSTSDTVTTYAVERTKPQVVAATNGYTVKLSHTHGCDWSTAVTLSATPTGAMPFVGATSRIVSLALSGSRAMAAVQEGSGSASRPHVLVSDSGSAGSWAARDNGLPAQGAPRLLRAAADGRTVYLTISPTATGGDSGGATGGVVPGLPGGGPVDTTPTGFLYRSVDGGASWTLQTGAADLPGGGTGFSQLDIDPSDSNRLYGIVAGRLLSSRDGGGTFTAAPGSGYTAVTATGPLSVLAFDGSGGVVSGNGGGTYTRAPGPAGVTSVAARAGHSEVAIEINGALKLLDANGLITNVPAASSARPGSLLGDRGEQSSFHALSGHSLLRYVDPVPKGVVIPPQAIGDRTIPPPLPGTVTPAQRTVSIPVGQGSTEDFSLALPRNRTPLDLFFLVDVSASMQSYIDELKTNMQGIVNNLTAQRINLKVGVGTIGTWPAKGERPYPDTYAYPPVVDPSHPDQTKPGPTYHKPHPYGLIRAIGQTGPSLNAAIKSVELETEPPGAVADSGGGNPHEGALLALEQAVTGSGIKSEQDEASRLPVYSEVAPGQEAQFRASADVRRVVILATNEVFDTPYGTPVLPGDQPGSDPRPDFRRTVKILKDNDVLVFGLSAGVSDVLGDLRKVSAGTRTFAPPGGVSCGGDPPEKLAAGAPLVCNNADGFSQVITRVLSSLVDRQNVRVVPHTRTPVLGALNGSALLGLDVKRPNTAPFQVRVSCVDVKPGTYRQDVDLVLRQTVVGRARVNVTCVKSNAALRPLPLTLANPPPPPAQPVPNPPVPPVAPAPPAAQPQVQPQVQTQVQIQPLTAGAMQEQQELQLALALNGTYKEDDPAFSAGQQMAMVDRRKREQVQALGLLAFAVVTCSGLGLARLRSRPELQLRRAR